MSLGNRIRQGTKWLAFGRFFEQITRFAFGVALARILMPADFGMVVTIGIFTGVASFLAAGGMGQALVQAKELEESHYRVVFTLQFLLCLGIYLFFFTIAPWFAVWYDNQMYSSLLRVSAISFLLRPFGNIPRSRLHRQMRFKALTMIRIAGMLFSGTASITMGLHHMGPWSLILGGLIGALVNIALLRIVTGWRPGFAFEKEAAKRLGGYGIRMSGNGLLTYLRNQTGNFILSRSLGPSLVGLYNKADSLGNLPAQTMIGSAFQTVFRGLSKVQDDKNQSRYIYLRTITLLTLYTLPVYVGIFWLAGPFIEVVYGAKWLPSAQPLKILTLIGLLRCIGNPAGAVVAAQNRLGYQMRIQIEQLALTVVACIIGVRWGIVGVAWGAVAAGLYGTVRIVWLANRCLLARVTHILRALKPGAQLNALLFLILMAAHVTVFHRLKAEQPELYLLGMAAVGGLSYLAAFLYLPIPGLLSEALRWKRALRLSNV